MKTSKFILTIAIMALPISVNAKDFFETAQRLHDYSIEHEKFKSGNEYNLSDMIYFTGYVMGVSDVLNGNGTVCTSASVSQGQVLSVVSKFLNDNPSLWNYSAESVVVMALKKTWHCKK